MKHLSRFTTFCEVNFIPENCRAITFFTIHNKGFTPQLKQLPHSSRAKFYTELRRRQEQTIQELAVRVRTKANTCDFASIVDPLDEALKTIFICAQRRGKASRTARVQLATETQEISKVDKPNKFKNTGAKEPRGVCYTCGRTGRMRHSCKVHDKTCNSPLKRAS
ncbi:hypothetical protein RF11_05544 [Thelohanellus kitauei]|uniref:Uncharacterized protein n=1 Tax=Thelohanellus kitauei TaxID=669202 RepID=A0A0C2NCT3_THEKT|nr:hypothetical protein RF11_05544 [Thelohanellus kitauei]